MQRNTFLHTSAIQKGIDYIASQQKRDGSFFSLSTKKQTDFTHSLSYESTFPTSLILSALNSVNKNLPSLQKVKKRCATFLNSQKSANMSFNYWTRDSKQAQDMPYPDDLDATFCALAALYTYDQSFLEGSNMANVVTLLTLLEAEEGGPYKTWLVPENADKVWHDVDIAVNSNIAYFLSLHDIILPQMTRFVEQSIEQNKLNSPYYPSTHTILYFISRFYKGPKKRILKTILLEENLRKSTNPLDLALTITALLNLKCNPHLLEEAVLNLLKQQTKGAWPAHAFCIDPAIKRQKYFAGSSALTTAICIEALQKYEYAMVLMDQKKRDTFVQTNLNASHKEIVEKVTQKFTSCDKELQDQASIFLKRIIIDDKSNQITLLPLYFSSSLETKEDVSHGFLVNLGVANLLGWLAYTIYDAFLDDEGKPQTLPVANFALRQLTSLFYDVLPDDEKFRTTFHMILDKLDSANAWEISNCRTKIHNDNLNIEELILPDYGNYEQLAYKSLGHALGPIAVLYKLGYLESSHEVQNTLAFFKHYLLARQLNDDAHDWEKDLRMGHINPVSALLLAKWRLKNPQSKMPLTILIPQLQELLWNDVIGDICLTVKTHTNLAHESLRKIPLMKHPDNMEKLIHPVSLAAEEALTEQKDILAFLHTYQPSTTYLTSQSKSVQ